MVGLVNGEDQVVTEGDNLRVEIENSPPAAVEKPLMLRVGVDTRAGALRDPTLVLPLKGEILVQIQVSPDRRQKTTTHQTRISNDKVPLVGTPEDRRQEETMGAKNAALPPTTDSQKTNI